MILLNAKHDNNCRKVQAVMPDGTIKEYKTMKECQNEFGISHAKLKKYIHDEEPVDGILFRDWKG